MFSSKGAWTMAEYHHSPAAAHAAIVDPLFRRLEIAK